MLFRIGINIGDVLTEGGRLYGDGVNIAARLNPRAPALADLGSAYLFTEQYEKAIAVLKRALAHNPELWRVHMLLAATYSELGREAEARAAAAEVLRINPRFSLEVIRQTSPYKDRAGVERFQAALRKAGLK